MNTFDPSSSSKNKSVCLESSVDSYMSCLCHRNILRIMPNAQRILIHNPVYSQNYLDMLCLCFNKLIRKNEIRFMHKTRIRLYLCYNICFNVFQYVSIKRRGCTEYRIQGQYREGVHIGCSLSVHACYKLAATTYVYTYFDVSRRLQCRSFLVLSCCQAGFLNSVSMNVLMYQTVFLTISQNCIPFISIENIFHICCFCFSVPDHFFN